MGPNSRAFLALGLVSAIYKHIRSGDSMLESQVDLGAVLKSLPRCLLLEIKLRSIGGVANFIESRQPVQP